MAFLLGISNLDMDFVTVFDTTDENSQKQLQSSQVTTTAYTMCKTVESILNLTAPNLLLPLHFRESLVLYSITGSRLAIGTLSSSGAHAAYQSVKTFLSNMGTEKPSGTKLKGDVVFAFDNNQILHRAWNGKVDGKFYCHIVTMVVAFEIDGNGKLNGQQ